MKDYLKSLFAFSGRELNGMLVLFILLLLLLFAQGLMERFLPRPEVDFSAFEKELALLVSGNPEEDSGQVAATSPGQHEDTGQVPAIGADGDRLALPGPEKSAPASAPREKPAGDGDLTADSRDAPRIPHAPGAHNPSGRRDVPPCRELELNEADSAALVALPGIGPVLAGRILRYRRRLGGFHSPLQLLEVFGLDSAYFRLYRACLRADTALLKKIDLNTAGFAELSRLPYWTSLQLGAVLNYREQHGPFSGPAELYRVKALDSAAVEKVIPYLLAGGGQRNREAWE